MRLNNLILSRIGHGYELVSTINSDSLKLNEKGVESLELLLSRESLSQANTQEEEVLIPVLKGYLSEGASGVRKHFTDFKMLGVELLHKCNLKCSHCYLGEKKAPERLNDDIFKKVVDNASRLGAYQISITGGEPFLDKTLLEKIKYCRDKDFKVTVNTNGLLINDEIAQRLKQLEVSEVIVTLNGTLEAHEQLYGEGTYEPTLQAIQRLRRAGVDVGVTCLIYDKNYGIEEQFKNSLREAFGITEVSFGILESIGQVEINTDLLLPKAKQLEVTNGYECGQVNDRFTPVTCNAGRNMAYVRNNGDVVPCLSVDRKIIGNVYDDSLYNIITLHS